MRHVPDEFQGIWRKKVQHDENGFLNGGFLPFSLSKTANGGMTT